jgi:hypothetical protein
VETVNLIWEREEECRSTEVMVGIREVTVGTKHVFFTEGARQELERLRFEFYF